MLEKLLRCSKCLFALLLLILIPPLLLVFGWLTMTSAVTKLF
jgi:hypothetical protein